MKSLRNSSIYEISGVHVRINAEWEYDEFHAFEHYTTDADADGDIEVNFKIIDGRIMFESEPVAITAYSRYYNKDGMLWRVYYSPPGREECSFICLNGKKQGKKDLFECYVPRDMLHVFRNSIQMFNAVGIEDLLMIRGVMVLHSSYIKWNSKAILFTAPSGTGKSTQAALWERYENARIINGDRTAISKQSGKWFANGLPMAGSSEVFINEKSELGAVAVLRQASENSISRLTGIEAVKYILNQVFIQGQFSASYTKAVNTAIELAENVPVFMLKCLPDKGAVDLLKKMLAKL